MSLINKMLQDLDRRHALGTGADAPAKGLEAGVHPVPKSRTPRRLVGSELFWWVMSGLMLIMVGWLGWVMWQLMPHSVITGQVPLAQVERAARGASVNDAARSAAAPGAGTNPPAVSSSAPAAPAPSIPPQPAAATGSAEPRPGSGAAKPAAPSVDMLKLATEIATPIPVRKPAAAPRSSAVPATPAAAPAAPASSPAASAPKAPAVPAAPPAPPAAPAQAAREPRIERQNAGGPAAAEAQYARAVALINQGRVSEGMDELRSVLAAAPRMDSARQTMVALLLEQRRPDEAEALLTQGLALGPGQSAAQNGFAMLLARLMVDRRDNATALAVLQKHAGAAAGNADYRAFTAAVLQRLERHAEAVTEYQAALGLSQQGAGTVQAGVWWVGLGISQEALGRKAEARDAFQRARASGALSRDVAAFVEQRLAQLQP
ncbi:MAG TPA: tetratricopeptide repeat protein [Burkholderiales bacterium]|nr:tetratricopeptide repeat protein [Burkholderiales bacterium]